MKIEKIVLKEFLGKFQMTETQQIQECVFDFTKEGLKINANSPAQQARSMAWLKTSSFKQYEELGKLGISDLTTFIKVIDRFDEEILFKHSGNLLTLSATGKTVDVELTDTSFISTDSNEPNLTFVDTFPITAKKLKEIFKDVLLNKDSVLTIETEKKKVKISNTGKYKFKHEFEAIQCNGGVKVNFGEAFIHSLDNLNGNLEISVKTDYPAKVLEKTENTVVTIIIAPRVEDKEE